jgi:hypothetical protein
VTPTDALRYLHFRSLECRDRDAHEALCLLIPSILKALGLDAMDGYEADAFRHQLKTELHKISEQNKYAHH